MEYCSRYRHSQAGFPVPEFVIFIGPTSNNSLSSKEDYEKRKAHLSRLFKVGSTDWVNFERALEGSFGLPIGKVQAEIRMGGWKGKTCPTVCINSSYSHTVDRRSFYAQVDRAICNHLCHAFMDIYNANWVVCQHWFYKSFQAVCRVLP